MEAIQFRVIGTPKAQPRARSFAFKDSFGRARVRVYEAGTAEHWKSCIAEAAKSHLPESPLDGPIRLDAIFMFERPQRLLRKSSPKGQLPHTSKPDRDNLDKALLDALTTIGFLKDDAVVCCGVIGKCYAAIGEPAGAVIRISMVTDTAEPLVIETDQNLFDLVGAK